MSALKISDLSIGDWIKAGGEPARVIQLGIAGRNKAKGLSGKIYGFLTSVEIQPIPITPEILEKNGFEENGGRWYNSNWRMEFEQYEDGWDRTINCGEYSVYFIKYVHQLQNAMRLVGIDKEIEL